MTLPRTLAMKECLEAWRLVLDQTSLSVYLLPDLVGIVAAYSVDVNKTVLERHCLIKLMELSIGDLVNLRRKIAEHYVNIKSQYVVGWRTSNDPYVVGCAEDFHQAFDWFLLMKKVTDCTYLDCILNQCLQTACCCEQPFTTKYLLSCFQNGDYYCY